ncbi:TetR/AcrR family transcriptional regulator [Gordonia caeni]|uniref:TetR/AcrR family transcriptional regulator n=1 Tax=Gordonia caeni TaxID=1007097 RepID=UPI0031D3E51C
MARGTVIRDYGGVSAGDRRAARRDKLIAAARRAWGAQGLGAVTVRGVVSEAGLTNRYFYEHFPNRDAVIVAVADQVREEMFTTLVETSMGAEGDVEARLEAALTVFLRGIAEDPERQRILTTEVGQIAGLENRRRETFELLAALILEYGPQVPGFTPVVDAAARRHAQFVVGGVNQVIDGWLAERDIPVEDLARVCTELCMAVTAVGDLR